jgi:ABC-2 type transport system permease protein
LRIIFDNMFMKFGGYPVTIFDRPARALITYLVPLAFMAWAPATILLDRTSELPFSVWIAWCSPLIGAVLLAVAAWVFMRESRHYQSAGN